MNIYDLVHGKILAVVEKLSKENNWKISNTESVTVEIPGDLSHGEIATNAAMVLAKQARKNPKDLAAALINELYKDKFFIDLEVAGPGFINITLNSSVWHKELLKILEDKQNYGRSAVGDGLKINLEFASPNPTGPMHVGHSRGAIYGDVLARLFEYAGYKVTKEYYVNDAGAQIGHLVHSCYLRYKEICGHKIGEFPAQCYPGDYVIDAAKELHAIHGTSLLEVEDEHRNKTIREFVLAYMIDLIKEDLALLDVHHDVFFYESKLHREKKIQDVINILEKKALVYEGTLEPPKGHNSKDWDYREQLLFKSTNFGDDTDRALQKSDGSWTYFAADIAYLENKISRKFDRLILVLGADHVGYQSRIRAAFEALKDYDVSFDVKFCQMVNFFQNGEVLKMSKRAGTFQTVRDVVEAVGKDILRFMMLTIRNDSILDFDLEKVKEMSKDNPVFYVQYAYARSNSVIEAAGVSKEDLSNFKNIELLNKAQELEIIRLLSYWPKQVLLATEHYEPHRIVIYLINLATKLHSFWGLGKDNKDLRFIVDNNRALTTARLTLLQAFITILENGLSIIGVTPTKKM